jgi:hypothetical protein
MHYVMKRFPGVGDRRLRRTRQKAISSEENKHFEALEMGHPMEADKRIGSATGCSGRIAKRRCCHAQE